MSAPDGAPFAAPVLGLRSLVDELWRAPCDGLIESEADIVEHVRLVGLDGEQIVGAAPEQIRSEGALGEHCIGGDGQAGDVGQRLERGRMVPISLVRFASGLMPTFFVPRAPWSRGRRCRAHAHSPRHRWRRGLAVDGRPPPSKGGVELVGVDANEDLRIAERLGGREWPLRRRTPKRSSALGPRSSTHSLILVPAHAAQRRGARERQHRQRMAPALAAAGVVDAVEERGRIWAALSIIFGAP